jgi:hypothetical protein
MSIPKRVKARRVWVCGRCHIPIRKGETYFKKNIEVYMLIDLELVPDS